MGSVRYANGEYAAEQPQGLPAVIAELTRWAAKNLELTFQSEINVGSRLSEKRKLKRRITKKCNTKGANQALARRKKRINQNGDREVFHIIFVLQELSNFLQAASNNGFSAVAR